MNDAIETVKYKGHIIRLLQDTDAESPREWDNVGEILYTSSRYCLGDRRADREEIDAIVERNDVIYLPVYAYIHSGTSLSTRPFSCPWDSGQCGIIWCTKAKAVFEWGKKLCTKAVQDQTKACLAGEIEVFNQYLNGEAVGYQIEGPLSEDSCWGFWPEENGKYDYCIGEAKSAIGYARKAEATRLRVQRQQAQEVLQLTGN